MPAGNQTGQGSDYSVGHPPPLTGEIALAVAAAGATLMLVTARDPESGMLLYLGYALTIGGIVVATYFLRKQALRGSQAQRIALDPPTPALSTQSACGGIVEGTRYHLPGSSQSPCPETWVPGSVITFFAESSNTILAQATITQSKCLIQLVDSVAKNQFNQPYTVQITTT
jgi:hypothetical protein